MRELKNLGEDEHIIMTARSRWTSFLLPAVVLAAYIAVVWVVYHSDERSFFHDAVLVAAGLWLLRFFAPRLSTYLALTNKRVYGEAGVLVTRTLDVPLDKVGGVYVEINPLGRITGRGTVAITTAGSLFEFPYIPGAAKFRAALMEEVKNAQDAAEKRQSQVLGAAIAASLRSRGSHPSRRLRP